MISLEYGDKILRTERYKLQESLGVNDEEIKHLKIMKLKEQGIHALVALTDPKTGKDENYQFINEGGRWKLTPKDLSVFQ